jgi:universal stress protein A
MSVIVVPTDFSELAASALPLARRMADALDAEIHCLHIVRDVPYYEGIDVILADSLPTVDEINSKSEQKLAAYVKSALPDYGDRAVPVVRIGTPFIQIIRYAREMHAQMIVISTHGHTGLKHVLLGSTTEAVVRQADCPVLSARSPEMEFVKP